MRLEIIGHAIVSADAMMAGPDGTVPASLRNDADWRRFQAELDRAKLVVLGRKSHQRYPNPGRHRLVATTSVAGLSPAIGDAHSMLWNPSGISFEDVLSELGIADGTIAIAGVFELFITRFTAFDLAVATRIELPGGVPCFASGDPASVLTEAGLVAGPVEMLDPAANVTLTRWQKP